ncbi:MAG TPA: selenium metabolism-associated LysR family transcriptional regulator, partial [Candidatus Tectomicrobia bacterium]|nr:selenium metabolism-associated LysR family transcriptional regulator [Candidatus Tectomicrobia bacterium]
MTFRQLEAFLAVARERSFSVAARRIHLSQPTLSEHVAELERELGAKLFVRTARGVGLTEAGRVLETYAARAVATIGDARRAMEELDGLQRGFLEIGASTTPGIYLLPGVVAAFRASYPGITLRLDIGNSRTIEERVQTNELDLGIVGGHELAAGERCLAAGIDDELFLVVPPRHRWARSRALAPARLAEEPLLLREEGSATRRVTERALQQAGIAYRAGMELGHTEAIKQAVMAGLGVAFLSVYAIRREVDRGDLVALRLQRPRIQRHFHVIHNEGRLLTASARAFMAALARQAPPALAGPPVGG